jgi:hypothetical protein
MSNTLVQEKIMELNIHPCPKYQSFVLSQSLEILAIAWSDYYLTIAFRRGFIIRYRDVPLSVYLNACENPTAAHVAEHITDKYESLIIGELE